MICHLLVTPIKKRTTAYLLLNEKNGDMCRDWNFTQSNMPQKSRFTNTWNDLQLVEARQIVNRDFSPFRPISPYRRPWASVRVAPELK
jgi:hypothetical protein